MPPFPAAAGGGPGQASCILLEVRLSAKHPHVSHQFTVPDVTNVCFLPPPPFFKPSVATSLVNTLALVPSHFDVASFDQEVDLPLQAVHSQHAPLCKYMKPGLADKIEEFSQSTSAWSFITIVIFLICNGFKVSNILYLSSNIDIYL